MFFSFLRSTRDSPPIFLSSAAVSGVSSALSSWPSFTPDAAHFLTNCSTSLALSSRMCSRTLSVETLNFRASPLNLGGPGISRSSPARTDSVVLYEPNQSLITRPFQPHSPRSRPSSSSLFSLQYVPLIPLYAVMKLAGFESRTAIWKGLV